jgi:hypothetical protein
MFRPKSSPEKLRRDHDQSSRGKMPRPPLDSLRDFSRTDAEGTYRQEMAAGGAEEAMSRTGSLCPGVRQMVVNCGCLTAVRWSPGVVSGKVGRSLQLRSRLMLSGIQIAKVQTVHNSRPRRIGRAGTGLGWRKSGKQLGEKTLVKVGSRVQEGEWQWQWAFACFADQLRRGRASRERRALFATKGSGK